jgi:hypothetical protein
MSSAVEIQQDPLANLRRCVQNPELGRGRPLQAAVELVRLVSEFVDSLPDHRSKGLLAQRARAYRTGVVKDQPFQKMCDVTRLWVLGGWKRVASKTGHLPHLPFMARRLVDLLRRVGPERAGELGCGA